MELIKIVQKSNLFIIRMLLQMSNDGFCPPLHQWYKRKYKLATH